MMPSEIEHVIVLMMENRSFDNVLGGLYLPDSNPPHPAPAGWLGLTGNEQNTCELAPDKDVVKVWNWRKPPSPKYLSKTPTPFVDPCPNPHEHYSEVQWQLFGGSAKPSGKVPIPPANTPPTMCGFATNYYDLLKGTYPQPEFYQYAQIMHYLSPLDLPVTSSLAYNFGVSDRWFASVPTQTYPNRLFSLIGTSNGLVDNDQWLGEFGDEDKVSAKCTSEEPGDGYVYAESVFHRIDDLPQGNLPACRWKVYYETHAIAGQIKYVQDRYNKENVAKLSQLYTDLKGTLPSFCWLEPKYGHHDGNSNHPPNNVLAGEQLILDVYKALRQSDYWEKTLLIITYDEHGGLYDHVSPPIGQVAPTHALQCPDCYDLATPNFDFTMYGVRVPTLLISPWIAPATVLQSYQGNKANFEHTTLIKTVFDAFGVTEPLDKRDAVAPNVEDVFTNLGGTANPGPDLSKVLDPTKPYQSQECHDDSKADPLDVFNAAAAASLSGRTKGSAAV